jgi:hypothetical protein
MKKGKRIPPKEGRLVGRRVLNAEPSQDQQSDWVAETTTSSLPSSVDLREAVHKIWSEPYNQGRTGSCVGQTVAKVRHWHALKEGEVERHNIHYAPSVRFLWMAPKEFDKWIFYPSTMLQLAGTYTKDSLDILRKHGCPTNKDLPFRSSGSMLPPTEFYKRCEAYKIKSYYAVSPWVEGKIKFNEHGMKWWLANEGPIVTRFDVDDAFMRANRRTGILRPGSDKHNYGGHASALVGYDEESVLLMNSWGTAWGDRGLLRLSWDWAKENLTESYGLKV